MKLTDEQIKAILVKDINIKKPYTKDTKKEKSCTLISII